MSSHHTRNRLFYTFKPLIPRGLQLFLRRRAAAWKRRRYAHIWPIDPGAGRPPEGWPGWPGGKQFAFVLSHDVDTRKGYDDVLKLVDLEERLGFRSQFNFVPERYGEISLDLIDDLKRRGFGVGVHGLKHDGKLFLSRRVFDRRAPAINGYLRKWGTRGFTSPSMHHNLEWLTALDIDYSTATFDTDPFEPQPDAAGTVFPFWVPGRGGRGGYVEIPYTLPQDSTLFVILRERSIGLWKRKLEWVAEKGGMALLNSHPDYMDFAGAGTSGERYPVGRYIALLEHVKKRFDGRYHHCLPAEVARLCRGRCRHPARSTAGAGSDPGMGADGDAAAPPGLRVAMLTYSFYESDNRVRRYAEALARRGDAVDVISLRRNGQGRSGELNGVRVFRVQRRVRDEKGKWDHFERISRFFLRSSALLARRHLERAYDLVHVHSVPDFEVFAALAPKLLGARVILDIHDIVPELFGSKFKVAKGSPAFKALVLAERLSIAFSDHAVVSNDLWRETLVSRSAPPAKCTSILNYPDEALFGRAARLRRDGRTVLLYPGTLNRHQGLDIAIRAFAAVKDAAPQADFHIYGEGPARRDLEALVRGLRLEGRVVIRDPVPLDTVVGIMAGADIGVVPKTNDEFGGSAFSTKTLEFMMLGVPIIVAATRIDRFYFDDSLVRFFEPGSVEDLAGAMLQMIRDKPLRERLAANALAFARRNSWEAKKNVYLELVDGLCGRRGRAASAGRRAGPAPPRAPDAPGV